MKVLATSVFTSLHEQFQDVLVIWTGNTPDNRWEGVAEIRGVLVHVEQLKQDSRIFNVSDEDYSDLESYEHYGFEPDINWRELYNEYVEHLKATYEMYGIAEKYWRIKPAPSTSVQ